MSNNLEILTSDELDALASIDPASGMPHQLDDRARATLAEILDAEPAHADVVPLAPRTRRRTLQRAALAGAAAVALAIAVPFVLKDENTTAHAAWSPVGTVVTGLAAAQQLASCEALVHSWATPDHPRPVTAAVARGIEAGRTSTVTETRGTRHLTSIVTGDTGATCLTSPDGSATTVDFHGRYPAPAADSVSATVSRTILIRDRDGQVSDEALRRARQVAPTLFRAVLGTDVQGVEISGPSLEPTRATIVGGIAIAWWPGATTSATTLTLDLADGSRRELPITGALVDDADAFYGHEDRSDRSDGGLVTIRE